MNLPMYILLKVDICFEPKMPPSKKDPIITYVCIAKETTWHVFLTAYYIILTCSLTKFD